MEADSAIAIAVRKRLGRTALVVAACVGLVVSLVPAQPVRALDLVRGPYLQLGTPTRVSVRWRTDLPAATTLRFGTTPGDLSTVAHNPAPITEHEVGLTTLQPDTRYYYSVGTLTETLAGGDTDHYFDTSPLVGSPAPTRIWVIGDSGSNNANSALVKNAYLAHAGSDLADVWLMLGDNAYIHGTDTEHTIGLFNNYPEVLRNTVLWPATGNHEFSGTLDSNDPVTETGPYFDAFTIPAAGQAGGVPSDSEKYYSFDYANIHFVVVEVYRTDLSVTGDMYQWLVADLAANNQDWTLVYNHFPPYSGGGRDSDTDTHMVNIRTIFGPVFEAGGVDLVFAGHSHSYERSMLIDGHYGVKSTFSPAHVVNGGDGDPAGDGPYTKPSLGPSPHSGTVYVVNGVAQNANTRGAALNHPVMVNSYEIEGSMLIDVDGNQLDSVFVTSSGLVLDHFQMLKGVTAPVPSAGPTVWVILASALAIGGVWVTRSQPGRGPGTRAVPS